MIAGLLAGEVRNALRPLAREAGRGAIAAALGLAAAGFAVTAAFIWLAQALGAGWAAAILALALGGVALAVWRGVTVRAPPPAPAKPAQPSDIEIALALAQVFAAAREAGRRI